MALPHPYFIAASVGAVLVCAGLAGVAGYRHGRDFERGAQAQATAAAIDAAVADARAAAQIESDRRVAAAQAEARRRANAQIARQAGINHALAEVPRPDCAWPAERLHHLASAIDAANASAPAPAQ